MQTWSLSRRFVQRWEGGRKHKGGERRIQPRDLARKSPCCQKMMNFLPLFLHSIQPHGCAETRSENMWNYRKIRADLPLSCCAGRRWGQIPKSVHSKCVGVKTHRGQMCRTSEEVRNNGEFQTGFLGTGSPDQSNHQAIVRFHQFSTMWRLWDHKLAQCGGITQTHRALFPIPHARTIELPVKKFGVRWVQIGVCRNQKNMQQWWTGVECNIA